MSPTPLSLSVAVRRAVKNFYLEILHEKLNKSEFDLIAVGRALLSDPDWANKVQDGLEEQIIPFDKSFVDNYV